MTNRKADVNMRLKIVNQQKLIAVGNMVHVVIFWDPVTNNRRRYFKFVLLDAFFNFVGSGHNTEDSYRKLSTSLGTYYFFSIIEAEKIRVVDMVSNLHTRKLAVLSYSRF